MRTQLHTHIDHDAAVTMRLAGPADQLALWRLAAMDSQPAPAGDVLIAEVGGSIRAAVPVAGGPAIADPFEPTANLVALLRERAAQVARPLRAPKRGHLGALRAA